MTTFLVPTNSVDSSAAACDYLVDRLEADDSVVAVNSLVGGDETSAEAVRDGKEALNVVDVRLGGVASVDTHQFVRGNEPAADVLEACEEFDPDELVISIRDRSPTDEAVFGSVFQQLLLDAERPVVSVPRER
ncbi:universal stress protein [Haloparvum sp. PAK95]|uniref:universal stress protein n=1 Tax=Haloparvum sp. PAK95 TaxID=3418962 RepID=UPI003D2ECB2A